MNLRFHPSIILSLISSITSAGARQAIFGSDLTKLHSSSFYEEKRSDSRRHTKQLLISASTSEQGLTNHNQLGFYYPDVGILHGGKSRHPRRLRNVLMCGNAQRNAAAATAAKNIAHVDIAPRILQVKEAPLCGTNGICLPSACDCRANGGVISDQCAPIFKSICDGYVDANGKNWTLEGCFDPGYPGVQKYARNAYCKMSECIVNGGSSESCYCQLYHSMCETYGNERLYNPFSLLGLCEVDECCQNKTDDAGRISCLIGYPNGFHSQDQYRVDHPRCGTNGTCDPRVCTCYANYQGAVMYCASPINDICTGAKDANGTKWEFEGCYRDYPDYPDLQLYVKTAYCELAKCVVDGGTYGSCYCQIYHSLCEVFGDVRKYHPIPNKAGFCTIDVCCQSKLDETGKSSCFELTNSTPTTSPTTVEGASNTPVQNPSNIAGGAPDTDKDTPTNDQPSNSAPNSILSSSAGALSSLVTVAAAISILGCDVTT